MSSMAYKIFLNPEVASGLGEDTFWTWFAREAGAEIGLPRTLARGDVVLHYSTMGKPAFPDQTVNLLWELYPEMSLRLGQSFARKNRRISKSLIARWHTVPTPYSRAFYSVDTIVMPIGVDEGLFSPAVDRKAAKALLGLDTDRPVAFWSGANHPMKGPDLRDAWFEANPTWQQLIAHKESPRSQQDLAIMMQASDAFLNTSRLIPFYMVDWECIASNLPMIEAGGISREFNLPQANPRNVMFERGWDRTSAISKWLEFIERCSWDLLN